MKDMADKTMTEKPRKNRVHLYKDDLKRLLEGAKAGKTIKELMKEFDVTALTVRRRCKEMGFDISKERIALNDKRRQLVAKLVSEGQSPTDVAKMVGVNLSVIHRWCHESNVVLRPKIDDKKKKELLEEVKSGKLVKEMAEKLGLNYDSACRICRQHGVTSSNVKRRYQHPRAKQKYVGVNELLKKGYSFEEIQRRTGIGYNYLCLLREQGLKMKKRDFEKVRDSRIDDLFSVLDELKKIPHVETQSAAIAEIFRKYDEELKDGGEA